MILKVYNMLLSHFFLISFLKSFFPTCFSSLFVFFLAFSSWATARSGPPFLLPERKFSNLRAEYANFLQISTVNWTCLTLSTYELIE